MLFLFKKVIYLCLYFRILKKYMKKIILIKPYFKDFYCTSNRNFPYGLFLISSILEQKGFDVIILDFSIIKKLKDKIPIYAEDLNNFYKKDLSYFSTFNDFYHFGFSEEESIKILKKIIKEKGNPLFIGISNFSYPYSIYGDKLASKIRKFYNGFIVAGGLGSSYIEEKNDYEKNNENDIKDIYDFIFLFESDVSIKKFIDKLNNNLNYQLKEDLEDVNNLYSKKYSIQNTIKFPEENEIESIKDKFIFEKFLENINKYFNLNIKNITQIYPHFSTTFSRGCPYRCNFCYNSRYNIKYRKRKKEDIINELIIAYNNGFTKINIDDDTFFYDKEYSFEILKGIKKEFRNRLELYFFNGINYHHLDEKVLKFIKKINIIKYTTFSLGTLDKKIQESLNRPVIINVKKDDTLNRIFELLPKYYIESQIFFISPFLNQTLNDVINSFFYILKTGNKIGFSIFYPVPPLSSFFSEDNLFYRNKEAFRSSFLNFKGLNLSREEIFSIFYFERVFNFILNFFKRKFLEKFCIKLLFFPEAINGFFDLIKYEDEAYINKVERLKRDTISIMLLSKLFNNKWIYFSSYKEDERFNINVEFTKFIFKENKNFYSINSDNLDFNLNNNFNDKELLKKIKKLIILFLNYLLKSEIIVNFRNLKDFILFLLLRRKEYFFITLEQKALNFKNNQKFIRFRYKFENLINYDIKKISIIIPFYERYSYFLFCLYSIFFQTFFLKEFFYSKKKYEEIKDNKIIRNRIDYEIIIIDDGSKKLKCKKIIKKLKENINKRKRLLKFKSFINFIFFSNFPIWIKDQYKSIFTNFNIFSTNIFSNNKFQNELNIKYVKENLKFNNDVKWDIFNKKTKKYFNFILNKKVKILELKKNFGVSFSRNEGIKRSSGDIIFFLDSDDLFTPYKIEKHLRIYKENKLIDGIINEEGWIRNRRWINKNDDFKLSNYSKYFFCDENEKDKILNLNKNVFSIGTISLKKKYLNLIGKKSNNEIFNTKKYFLEDFEFFLNYLINKNIFILNEILNLKRSGNFNQLSSIYRKEIHDFFKNY